MGRGRCLALGLLVAAFDVAAATTCQSYSRNMKRVLKGVCVCTAQSCHQFEDLPENFNRSADAVMFVTSKQGKRFESTRLPVQTDNTWYLRHRLSETFTFTPQEGQRIGQIPVPFSTPYSTTKRRSLSYQVDAVIDLNKTGQTLMGFGGAWNDATAINLYEMDTELQDDILRAYYGEAGLRYTIGRIPMASTDFSLSIYSYNDQHPDDFSMDHFSIEVDLPPSSNKIPMILRIINLTKQEQGRNLTIFSSPWAPPTWMTVENSTLNCHMIGYPDGNSPYWKAWALYFSKFLTAYNEQGIAIKYVTVQNEPIPAPFLYLMWQSMRFNDTTERDFIKYELGPRLRLDHPEVQIIMMDDQKTTITEWKATLEDPESKKYVSGLGFHWYQDADFVLWKNGDFDALSKHHEQHPDVFLLGTEACEGYMPRRLGTGKGVRITEANVIWQRAENYARDIMGDLQHFAVGWTEWGVLLNMQGGPTWVENYVDSPILLDTVHGNEWYKQPTYFIMAHYSRYLPPGSVCLPVQMLSKVRSVEMVAFRTPDDKVVAVFQNRNALRSPSFRVSVEGLGWVAGSLDADSVATVVIPL